MSDNVQHNTASKHAAPRHVTPISVYLAVFGALAIGTLLTVYAASVDLGILNTPIGLLIACTKAVLVVLFFMHVLHSSKLTWAVIVGAFLWLGVLFVLTFADYLTRAWPLS